LQSLLSVFPYCSEKEGNANANARDCHLMSPLQLASALGHLPATQLLLDKGADLNATDEHGFTALHSAAFFGRVNIVEALLARGAAAGAPTKSGVTPLMIAEQSGNFVLVGMINKLGAQHQQQPEKKKSVELDLLPSLEPVVKAKQPNDDDLPQLEQITAKKGWKHVSQKNKTNFSFSFFLS
jgi:ankyrin repeat protein